MTGIGFQISSDESFNSNQEQTLSDDLLKDLDYNFLYLNFTKLLLFLENNDSFEICFPFISKRYQDIFKLIVLDVNVLKSKSLDTNYRYICNKILDTVNSNKYVYMLEYVHEQRKEFNNVLVLKKIYLKNDVKIPPLCLSSSSRSLDSLEDSESSMDKFNDMSRSSTPGSVNKDFKLHCMKTALAFVKNYDIKIINFPNLNSEQQKFIHTLLISVVAYAEFDSNFGAKNLYMALWEAFKIYSLKYYFRVKIETKGDKKSLVFMKLPKSTPDSDKISSKKNNNKKVESNTKLTKTQKKTVKINNIKLLVENLRPSLITDTLNKVIHLLSDEQEASCIFQPKNEQESEFYSSVLLWAREMLTRPIFSEQDGRMFDRISELLNQAKCNVITSKKSRRNKKSGFRQITYIKEPKFSSCSQSRNKSNKVKTLLKENCIYSDGSIDTPTKNKNKSLSKKAKKKLTRKLSLQQLASAVQQPDESVGQSEKIEALSSTPNTITNKLMKIDFKPASSNAKSVKPDLQDSGGTPSTSDRCSQEYIVKTIADIPKHVRDAIPERFRLATVGAENSRSANEKYQKVQLMEGLQVPVHSEKAMRMMKGMGWSGGALGVRGNGITEPLMPVLDTIKGRGFGHVDSKITIKPNNISTTSLLGEYKPYNIFTTSLLGEYHPINMWRTSLLGEYKTYSMWKNNYYQVNIPTKPKPLPTTSLVAEKVIAKPKLCTWNICNYVNKVAVESETISTTSLVEEINKSNSNEKIIDFEENVTNRLNTISKINNVEGKDDTKSECISTPTVIGQEVKKPNSIGKISNFEEKSTDNSNTISKINNVEEKDATESKSIWNMSNFVNKVPPNPTNTETLSKASLVGERQDQKPEDVSTAIDFEEKGVTEPKNLSKSSHVEEKVATKPEAVSKPVVTKSVTQKETKEGTQEKYSKSESKWFFDESDLFDITPTPRMETDVIVPKTKELLKENYTFENLLKIQNSIQSFRQELLMGILELLSSNETKKVLRYKKTINKKNRNFLVNATHTLGNRERITLSPMEQCYADAVYKKYMELPGVIITGCLCKNNQILLTKQKTITQEEENIGLEIWVSQVTENNMETFIQSLEPTCLTKRNFTRLKFRIIILLEILFFLKTDDDDLDVAFDKILPETKRQHIQNVVEDVNMRLLFGSSRTERRVTLEISKYTKDTYLGIMFSHDYTAFNLTKFTFNKRSER